MIVLVYLFFIALLGFLLYLLAGQETPLLNLMILAAMGYLGYLAYLNLDDLVTLRTSIKNFPDAVAAYAAASWNELLAGMTAWGWVGFGLALVFVTALGLAIALPSAKALAAVEVGRLERQLQRAQQEAARERDKARQAEQAAAQDREAARLAASLQASAERRAQGLEGQLEKSVRLADSRGKQLRDIREKKRAEKARPPLQDQPGKARLPRK